MGDGEHTPAPGLICPVCFTIRAWKRGVEGWDSQWNWVLPGTEFAPVTDVVDASQERNDALEAIGDLRSLLATAEGDKAAFLDVIAERTIERDAALARVAELERLVQMRLCRHGFSDDGTCDANWNEPHLSKPVTS